MSFQHIESYITDACHAQDTLRARNKHLMNEMADAFADKRKYDYFQEHERQRNINLKIMIQELHKQLMFLCDRKT